MLKVCFLSKKIAFLFFSINPTHESCSKTQLQIPLVYFVPLPLGGMLLSHKGVKCIKHRTIGPNLSFFMLQNRPHFHSCWEFYSFYFQFSFIELPEFRKSEKNLYFSNCPWKEWSSRTFPHIDHEEMVKIRFNIS